MVLMAATLRTTPNRLPAPRGLDPAKTLVRGFSYPYQKLLEVQKPFLEKVSGRRSQYSSRFRGQMLLLKKYLRPWFYKEGAVADPLAAGGKI